MSGEKIEQVVRTSSSSTSRRYAVTTRPLAPEIGSFVVSQEHFLFNKEEVYGYLRSLHPYPLIRGSALEEVNNADSMPFDVFRIPKPGHHPKGLGGVVFDLPEGVTHQTPLSLEILGKGKELIIEEWPPSYYEEQVRIDPLPADAYQDFMEMERIPQDQDQGQDDVPAAVGTADPNLDSSDVSLALGGLLDQLQGEQDVGGSGVELFADSEVVSSKDRETDFPPQIGLSLPPLSVEEFVPSLLDVDGYVRFKPRIFDIRNNGAVRFLVVNRPRGTSEWQIPDWRIACQIINAVQNECYETNASCLRAFHWANSWRGVGLISLYSSEKYVGFMNQFRALFTSVTLADFVNMDFNTYPKDLLPCSEVRLLLKSALRNFNPRFIPAALFNQNSGLEGSLRLHSSKPVQADSRARKTECKDGWSQDNSTNRVRE